MTHPIPPSLEYTIGYVTVIQCIINNPEKNDALQAQDLNNCLQ